jgi:hypothetical protein
VDQKPIEAYLGQLFICVIAEKSMKQCPVKGKYIHCDKLMFIADRSENSVGEV